MSILTGDFLFKPPPQQKNFDDYITYDVYVKVFFDGTSEIENGWINAEFTGAIIQILMTGRREFP